MLIDLSGILSATRLFYNLLLIGVVTEYLIIIIFSIVIFVGVVVNA